jgi:DNA-binding transcriptional MerR regulator
MIAETYDIQRLVNETGVPRRTIYFYVQQGILPPPEGAGLAAHYGENHLLRLRLIPVLRQRGLRLDDIRARFTKMTRDEMRSLLAAHQPGTLPPQPASALKTIQEIPGVPPAGWGEQHFTHYSLPAGITLSAPENLSQGDRQRLQMLLQAARQIFSGGPFYSINAADASLPDRGSELSQEEE